MMEGKGFLLRLPLQSMLWQSQSEWHGTSAVQQLAGAGGLNGYCSLEAELSLSAVVMRHLEACTRHI